jgi:serpin B
MRYAIVRVFEVLMKARTKGDLLATDRQRTAIGRPATNLVTVGSLALLFAFTGLAANTNSDTEGVITANTAFALDVYGKLKDAKANLFLSPYSISACLAMAQAGARGGTESQMAQALRLTQGQEKVNVGFAQLQSQLSKIERGKGVELAVASGLWGQKGHKFEPAFIKTLKRDFGAEASQMDFQNAPERARQQINSWVAKQTRGKIQDLLKPGALDPTTRMVLADAIYFKGRWARPFDRNKTTPVPFRVSEHRQVQVPLMNVAADFDYAEVDGLQLISLPYAGGDLAMVVLLPASTNGLAAVEAKLSPQAIQQWLAGTRQQKVKLSLPRFKLETQLDLNQTLVQLGMHDAFGAQADFSGIDGARDLYLSLVTHKALVEVNEEGTEAAASTGATLTLLGAEPPVPVFRADHPFIFLIREVRSGIILFLGKLANPSA